MSKLKPVAIGVILLALMVAIFSPNEEVAGVSPGEMLMDEYIPYLIKETVGEGTNHEGKKRLIKFNVKDNKLNLILLGDDNFGNNLIRKDMLKKGQKIFNKGFKDRKDIEEFTLEWQFPMADKKGNEFISKVMTLSVTKENNKTINWENVSTENIPTIVDQYWEHPALKE